MNINLNEININKVVFIDIVNNFDLNLMLDESFCCILFLDDFIVCGKNIFIDMYYKLVDIC